MASLTQFGETYELNSEDSALMEGLQRRKGAATADMRIVLARSHAQAAAIDYAVQRTCSQHRGMRSRVRLGRDA